MSILTNETYANKGAPLGEEVSIPGNRVYRYTKNGPVALKAGTVLQGPRPNESHDNLTCAATAVGKTFITVTLAAGDPISINDYTDGYIYVNDQAGEGYLYDIVSNGGGFGEDSTCSFNIKQQLIVALTTSSQATLVKNPYENVSRPFGDPWDIIVGVAPVAVPADEYFWCQVRGPAAVLQAGGLFAGRGVMLSQWKPGAVEVLKQVVPVNKESLANPIKETSGKATIADSATSTTITHGLGSTPLLENITIIQGEDATNALTAFWVDTITATQFNINCNDPGGNNLDVGWRAKASTKEPYVHSRSEVQQFQQKGIELRLQGDTQRTEPDDVLTEVSGKATVPERVIGYCINPRVSEEYALVYLTLS